MKKNLRYFMTLLLMMVASVGWSETSTLTFTAACNGSGTADDGVAWTVTSDADESQFDNTRGIHYGTSKKAVSYLTLTTSGITGTISKIVVNASGASETTATVEVTVGGNPFGSSPITSSATDYTFEGSASGEEIVVKVYQNSAKKALYVKSIAVTYTTGGTLTCAKPTFTPEEGTYSTAQSVTLRTSTEGATIYYTLDGSNPTTNSTVYSDAINVSETTTIKAFAAKNGYNDSGVAEATYTITQPKSISEVRAQVTGDVFTKGIVTSCSGTTGYIQDATAAICVYGKSLKVGDEVTVQGTLSTFNGLLEITSPEVVVLSSENTVEPEVMTIADILGEDAKQGWLVKIENATVTGIEKQNTTIAQGDNTIVVRDIDSNIGVAVNNIITLVGNIGCYNGAQIANPTNVEIKSPVINANNVELPYDANSGEIPYTIKNAVSGVSLSASTEADWISNITVESDKVTFTATANVGTETRTATITLAYGDVTKDVTVTQAHQVIDFTTLPFNWEGGVKADLLDLNGVTASGLGSDYAESNAPYRVRFDNTGDYIQVKTDKRPGVVTIGVKMLGGANTSSIVVQQSADGVDFSALETLDISGAQYDELSLNTTKKFAENSRYVRLSFTKGSNVGVGPISISEYATINFSIAEACTDGTNYFGTFYTDKAYVMPEGVTGQTVDVNAGKLVVNDAYEAGSVVPANTPLLMKATAAGEKTALVTTGGDAPTSTNMLKGTLTAEEKTTGGDNDKYYRLTMHNGTTLGFYYGAADGAAFTPGANKAYLAVPASTPAKEGFAFGETTGINNVNAVENTNEKIFNLAGQQMKSAVKGVYIKNGRKYVK